MSRLADFLAYLAEPALRALIVACVAALVLAVIPRKRAAMRLYIWSGVLYIALAMPLLGAFLPRVNFAVPASVWHVANAPVTPAEGNSSLEANTFIPGRNTPGGNNKNSSVVTDPEAAHRKSRSKPAVISATESASPAPAAMSHSMPATTSQPLVRILARVNWKAIIVGIYLLGLFILLARLLSGVFGSRRLAASAEVISTRYFPRKDEIEDSSSSAALDMLSLYSRFAGLKIPPCLKESAALSVPATVGLRHPVILLPPGWRTWTRNKLEAVLAHEISHVARRDAFTQLLSLVHRAVFWFSPLAWWLDRHLAELAEQASDEAALAGGADRTLYAETLLEFFVQLESATGRVRWQALCMANRDSSGRAERRIDRILTWKGATTTKKSFIVGLIALAAPVVFATASVRPFVTQPQSQAQTRPSPSSQPAATIAPASPPATLLSGNAAPTLAFRTTQETSANSEKQADQDQERSADVNTSKSFFYGYGSRYVILSGDSKNVSMSGNNEDLQHALALRKSIKGDFIWFERDEKSYIITDPAFIAKAKALFAPQEELGRKQDALGRQQDELGRQQDELGGRMEKISVKVPDITPDLERIRARLKELEARGATQSELGSLQSQLGELQSRIGRLQSEAGQQQSVIGHQQSELGRKQGELGRQQGELGRQQGEIARKASRELHNMFEDAIAKGIAKPE
jgi:beta-lactamase regulating signal transducer with metallopeptidase domain